MANRAEDPKDILFVRNIDTGCLDREEHTIPVLEKVFQAGQQTTRETQRLVTIDHSQWFEARFDKKAYRLKPNEVKEFPRYIAEHIAKHLADHILMKQEIADTTIREGLKVRPNYVRNLNRRINVLKDILVGVKEYFIDTSIDYEKANSDGSVDYDQIANEDDGKPAQDLGKVGKSMMMGLETVPLDLPEIKDYLEIEEVSKRQVAKVSADKPAVDVPRLEDLDKASLLTQAMALGIEVDGKERKDDLLSLIKANT